MKKKYIRLFSIIFGILLLLFLIVNFGLNFWLKYNLPNYIKKNSDYIITYKTLDVDTGTGNIHATGITINNQNPDRTDKLGLQGTVDTLSISRLGIYDLIFSKSISTDDLTLNGPNLNIVLPKPIDEKTSKKSNTPTFKNINISEGNIQVFRPTKQKLLSVKELDLSVENLEMTEKSVDNQLPIAFEKYHLKGKNFFFRPDNVYAFTAQSISTEDGQMNVKNFAMIPLLSYQNFLRYYPKKRNLFDVKATEMSFKDIIIKNNKLSLTNVKFESPQVTMFTTNVKSEEKKKSFTYDVNLENVLLSNAKINILKPSGTPFFAAENLTMQINQLVMNDETAKGNIPFQYNDFDIKGENINYVSATENVKVASLNIQPKSADLQNISVKPTSVHSDKTSLDLTAQHLQLKINNWEFIKNKLKLDIQNVLVNQLNGTVKTASNPQKKKPTFDGIQFPLTVKNVVLKNSNLEVDSKNQPLVFKDLNANIQQIEMNDQTIKDAIPFKTGNYSLTTRNFNYKTKFYNLSASLLKLNKNTVQISNFAMKPTVSRTQYIRMIPTEKDLYDLKINQITANGKWDLVSESKFLDVDQITLNQLDANVFRSKIPKDDLSEKPMYSKLLRSIKFPVFVQNLDIKNSLLVYEEDTKKSDGPGKLTFNNLNLSAKNVNSGKMKNRPTQIPITIQCQFMNASPMNVKWSFDTANMNDAFAISGNIADLPASRINPFIEPYLKVRATGLISDLIFNFKGTQRGIGGTLKMVHQNLKVSILKQTGEKDKILSAVANIFVRTDSGNYPESVEVEEVERDKTKSFFNLFWRGIEQGLKKTLIGKNAPKTEQSIKNTVENTKSALEQNRVELKETKAEVKQKVENAKQKVQEKKEAVKEKGIFRNLFKKKTDSV
ncbi:MULTISPECIES: hypothetical protein [unclassified Kaistella]|uniref:hypothetical protein n=1 Tax=unclassified Kaistella TaxID=2762626 RepID=UPI002734BF35|nr:MULTISPECIES: hypothetical protein [unclassified Kaistella]MDP2452917.1 hypothetical protein [Kaistella sp. SH11-4b]MDP2455826.1 hypothetical protein [Kaistella sp. SH40-3]MDP2458730.1 hypothetical protein [Kaistella sp. SH19-2b]